MSDLENNLRGTGDVLAAYDRLVAAGLASSDTTARGLTRDGSQTLSDLLAVLVFQTGQGDTPREQVASATARAMLSALGDLFADMAGQPTNGADTLQLLAAAVREARA